MHIDTFIQNFSNQFDETEPETFSAYTKFKELEEWSSLIALSVIVMVDQEYGVRIDGDDIRSSEAIADLYNIVNSRKNV